MVYVWKNALFGPKFFRKQAGDLFFSGAIFRAPTKRSANFMPGILSVQRPTG